MNLLWVVAQEVLLLISISGCDNIPRLWLILTVLPEEMANDNSKCNPDHEDLEHQPKVNFGGCSHAFVSLRLKINELHEEENTHLEK